MLNEKKESIIESIKNILDKSFMDKHEDGTYSYDVYVDSNDELSDDSIKKIVKSDDPMATFYEQFNETLAYNTAEYNEMFNTIRNKWKDTDDYDENEEFIRDWVYENVRIDFPYDHFLKQEIDVNIIVDTGDGNQDFTLNNFISYNAEPDEEIDEDSSILWLVRQQGYTKEQLEKAVREQEFNSSKFLESIYEECLNVTSHMNALAFFVKIPLDEYLELDKNHRDLELSKDTICGLYDSWNGAGGLINIALDKNVKIPKDYIGMHVDGTRGYGAYSIYGDDSFWKDTIIKSNKE